MQVDDAINRALMRHPGYLTLTLGQALAVAANLAPLFSRWMGFQAMIVICVTMLGINIVIFKWRQYIEKSVFKSMLPKLGVRLPYCLTCQYNLRGSISTHCPECGTLIGKSFAIAADQITGPDVTK